MSGAHRAESGPEERTPEELREDLGELRAELGETVEELANRVDVPARVRAKRDETTERVQQQVAQAREVLKEKAPAVDNALQDRRTLVGIAAVLLSLLVFSRLRRRKQRRSVNGAG